MALTQDLEDDEFFGNDSDDDRMAEKESNAAGRNLQTIAYLDAFDEHKERRLQEGFEVGYRDVHDLAVQLGERLGQISASAKLQEALLNRTENGSKNRAAHAIATDVARRYRVVMGEINKGEVLNASVKEKLLELEAEINRITSG